MSNKPNPIKAAKVAREKKLNLFIEMHPKENKHWSVTKITDFCGDKCTLEELNEQAKELGVVVKILIKKAPNDKTE